MMFPKNPRQENRALLDLARGKPCLLRIVPCAHPDTTVAAHSNWMAHGKGKGMKAHDFYTVWACARCHDALDSSQRLTADEKRSAFEHGHIRQVQLWQDMIDLKLGNPKEIKAAKWALDELKKIAV